MKRTAIAIVTAGFLIGVVGCSVATPTSDQKQQAQQEQLLQEGTAQTGMPAIKNFRERKLLKDILEMRDQEGLVTYTYLENEFPNVSPGKTALGGKLTFLGQSVGYGIPYATQYTSPEKIQQVYTNSTAYTVVPQADPNGLFSPAATEGTWVILSGPDGSKPGVVYVEPRITVLPFKLAFD